MVALASVFRRPTALAGSYLCLPVGAACCAIPLHRSSGVAPLETLVCRHDPASSLAMTADLNGLTIPLFSLRSLLGNHEPEPQVKPRTCVTFVQAHTPDGMVDAGLIVADIPTIVDFAAGDISVRGSPRRLALATARKNGRMFTLLDLDAVWLAHAARQTPDPSELHS